MASYRSYKWQYYKKQAFDFRIDYGKGLVTVPCYYCGVPATSEDHVLPLVALDSLLCEGTLPVASDLLTIVPSCIECNSLAGDKVFNSRREKKRYIQRRLANRYADVLNQVAWDDEEIEEMEGDMRRTLELLEHERRLVQSRIEY